MNNFKNCDNLVKNCLKDYPSTRGSDRELIKRVWEKQGYKLKDLQLYYMIHQPKSIVRSRRKWQAKGLFRPTDKVIQQRLDSQKEYKDNYKKKTGHYCNKTNTYKEE